MKEVVSSNKFKFGPSRIYPAKFSVKLPLRLLNIRIVCNFYVVDGDIPILIGNDILEPLGGVIDTDLRTLKFKEFDREINMVKTSGGHFVLPVVDNRSEVNIEMEDYFEIKENINLNIIVNTYRNICSRKSMNSKEVPSPL